jgi:hypothetical protein
MDAAIIVAELAAAYAAATITFGAGYAACLAAANKRSKLKWNHLFGFGLLTPVLWISMSALTGLAGAYCDALPPNLSALLYAAIICAIPSAILSASVIDDIKAPRPPPPPKNPLNPQRFNRLLTTFGKRGQIKKRTAPEGTAPTPTETSRLPGNHPATLLPTHHVTPNGTCTQSTIAYDHTVQPIPTEATPAHQVRNAPHRLNHQVLHGLRPTINLRRCLLVGQRVAVTNFLTAFFVVIWLMYPGLVINCKPIGVKSRIFMG